MKVLVCLAFLVSPFLANAKSFIQPFDAADLAQPQADACTNFSGNWVGTCGIGNKPEDSKLTIQQYGCDLIIMDGQQYRIGGQKTIIDSSKRDNIVVTLTLDWDANKIYLAAKEVYSIKSFEHPVNSNGLINATVKIEDEKLITEATGTSAYVGENGETSSMPYKMVCVYQKN